MAKKSLPPDVEKLIDKYANEYGVSPALAKAVAMQESGGDQNAISRVGALGVMQLMPDTAQALGVDPLDLEGNIKGGVKYLSYLINHNDNVEEALAAYNAGQHAVDTYGGIPPYGETQQYVKNIMKNAGMQYTPKPPTKGLPAGQALLQRIQNKRERIAALPPDVQGAVLDRLYDMAIAPHVPAAMNDQQKALVKQRFRDSILGKTPTVDTSKPTQADYSMAGLPTGVGGSFQEGVMRGTGNLFDALNKASNWIGQKTGTKPGGLFGSISKPMLASADLLKAASGGEHPLLSAKGGAQFAGQMLPTVAEVLVPGAPKGARLLPRVAAGAGKGAVGMLPFDPSVKGATIGAVFGGGMPLLGRFASKVFSKAKSTMATKVTDPAVNELEKIAQAKFGKGLADLFPQQKMDALTEWKEQAVKATEDAKAKAVEARKAARAAKVQEKVKAINSKVDEKVAVRRAMDEAKALQKQISAFVKANKRAPNEAELAELRKKVASGEAIPAPPPKAKPTAGLTTPAPGQTLDDFIKKQIEEVRKANPGRELTKEEIALHSESAAKVYKGDKFVPRNIARNDFQRSMTEQINEARQELAGASTNEEKFYYENRLNQLIEMAKTGVTNTFKAENPEAIKAASAAADIAKAQGVIKVPEGVSGLSESQQALNQKLDEATAKLAEATDPKVKAALQKTVENLKQAITTGDPEALKRISDAERKAAGRATAAAETTSLGTGPEGTATAERVASTAKTPEEVLQEAESQFFNLTDQLEELGQSGKTLAKQLNILWKKPPKGMSRQQVIEGAEKALEMLKKGGKAAASGQ